MRLYEVKIKRLFARPLVLTICYNDDDMSLNKVNEKLANAINNFNFITIVDYFSQESYIIDVNSIMLMKVYEVEEVKEDVE